MKKLFQDFKKFCSRGNILELATGVMIGGAFTTIVNSLVNDMLMPVIGLLTGGVNLSGLFFALDFQSYPSAEAANAARGWYGELRRVPAEHHQLHHHRLLRIPACEGHDKAAAQGRSRE